MLHLQLTKLHSDKCHENSGNVHVLVLILCYRLGHMSINQAAIHYNLPYSSLYGRFKRGIKYETENLDANSDSQSHLDAQIHMMDYSTNSHQQINYQQHPPNS